MTLSETLRFIRKRRGLTQRHVADKLGISTVTFSKIETGKISPRLSLLEDLAGIYGGEFDWDIRVPWDSPDDDILGSE